MKFLYIIYILLLILLIVIIIIKILYPEFSIWNFFHSSSKNKGDTAGEKDTDSDEELADEKPENKGNSESAEGVEGVQFVKHLENKERN